MVLQPGGCGRVGRRRTFFGEGPALWCGALLAFLGEALHLVVRGLPCFQGPVPHLGCRPGVVADRVSELATGPQPGGQGSREPAPQPLRFGLQLGEPPVELVGMAGLLGVWQVQEIPQGGLQAVGEEQEQFLGLGRTLSAHAGPCRAVLGRPLGDRPRQVSAVRTQPVTFRGHQRPQ